MDAIGLSSNWEGRMPTVREFLIAPRHRTARTHRVRSKGYTRWFERNWVWIGNSAEIKTNRVREQKTKRPIARTPNFYLRCWKAFLAWGLLIVHL